MPSRCVSLAIVFFWLVAAGWFIARDIAPHWRTGDAPPYRIGLADEAMRQIVPIRWRVYRGDQQIALLRTSLRYDEKDDTSEFVAECAELPLFSGSLPIVGRIEINARHYRDSVRVDRDGELRAMATTVDLVVKTASAPEIAGRAEIGAQVRDGQLHRQFRLSSPAFGELAPDLEPTEPPRGCVLNPMHPIPRLTGLEPGQQWRQRLVAPHDEILKAALAKLPGSPLGGLSVLQRPRFLNAEVMPATATVNWDGRDRECLVVEFHGDNDDGPIARTWVQRSDGEILRQEAESHGTKLTLQRE